MNIAVDPQLMESELFATPEWIGRIELEFSHRKTQSELNHACSGQSYLSHIKHYGPLRVQRPFYPEGNDCCHVYLLHPPGGLVSGDHLSFELRGREDSHGLITTPAAGKIYRANNRLTEQRQDINITVDNRALIEWLPQETIVFDGSAAVLNTRINLAEQGELIGWDFLCLGRPASEDFFDTGYVKQNLEIWRGEKPLLCDRSRFIGGSELLKSSYGLGGNTVYGLFYSTLTLSEQFLSDLQDKYNKERGGNLVALTQRNDVFIARYLGASAEKGKAIFSDIWADVRKECLDREIHKPRIWNT